MLRLFGDWQKPETKTPWKLANAAIVGDHPVGKWLADRKALLAERKEAPETDTLDALPWRWLNNPSSYQDMKI